MSSLLWGSESEKASGREREKKRRTFNAREREGNLGRQALKVKQCDNP